MLLKSSLLFHKSYQNFVNPRTPHLLAPTISRKFTENFIIGREMNVIDRTLALASKAENQGEYPQEFIPMEHFKMGFTEGEFEDVDPQIKKIFTLNNASDSEILQYRIDQAIKKFQKHPLDTASLAVRIACVSERIIHKIKYFYATKKRDMYLYRQIQMSLHQRDKLMAECRIAEPNYFRWVCDEYKLPYEMQSVMRASTRQHLSANTAQQSKGKKALRKRVSMSKNNYPKNWPHKGH